MRVGEFLSFLDAARREEAGNLLDLHSVMACAGGNLKEDSARKVIEGLHKRANPEAFKPKRYEGAEFVKAFDALIRGIG